MVLGVLLLYYEPQERSISRACRDGPGDAPVGVRFHWRCLGRCPRRCSGDEIGDILHLCVRRLQCGSVPVRLSQSARLRIWNQALAL
jgi:hypothetical protein